MTISMYQASVPLFRTLLGALSGVLDKGAAFAEEKKFDPSVLVNARLAPDMFHLARQVQVATSHAAACAARLAGVEPPTSPDTDKTFGEMKARIAKTIAYLDGIKPAQIDGSEERKITLKMGANEMTLTGQRYLIGFEIPNVTFHCTTAYTILRHNGVDVGKRDFLGAF
jgi:hypothetical protein